jgi:hypothetical protein
VTSALASLTPALARPAWELVCDVRAGVADVGAGGGSWSVTSALASLRGGRGEFVREVLAGAASEVLAGAGSGR